MLFKHFGINILRLFKGKNMIKSIFFQRILCVLYIPNLFRQVKRLVGIKDFFLYKVKIIYV